MWGLIVATVVGLAILIGLGTWQYQRLQWKTRVLDEIERAATAAPLSGYAELRAAMLAGDPVDFRRIDLDIESVEPEEYHIFRAGGAGRIDWRIVRPVVVRGLRSGSGNLRTVFAAMETRQDARKEILGLSPLAQARARTGSLAGYVRLARERPRGTLAPNVERNRYYGFFARETGASHPFAARLPDRMPEADVEFYVDAELEAERASELPPRRPELANNHFQYMLTWWSFAVILIVVSVVLHLRQEP